MHFDKKRARNRMYQADAILQAIGGPLEAQEGANT